MFRCIPDRKRRKRWLLLALVASGWLSYSRLAWAGDVILFAASTDVGVGGFPSVSTNPSFPINNLIIPTINPSVTITPPAPSGTVRPPWPPGTAYLNGQTTGPLNGITYDTSLGFNGGTTGWVGVSYTIATTGSYSLMWEVANTLNCPGNSALAFDNIQLNNKTLFDFGSGIPAGFQVFGTAGTSTGIPGLAPSAGSAFGWIDSTGGQVPIFDTVDGNSASQLYSVSFAASAGDVLTLDAAFLTNDGGPFDDYGIINLAQVPEPSSATLALTGIAVILAARVWRKRRPSRGIA
jgi:hypothetical protein